MVLALLLAGGVLLAGFQDQAKALSPHPPVADLKQENTKLQRAYRHSYCWIRRCVDNFEDNYPPAVTVEPDTRLYIRLSENWRPKKFTLKTSTSPNGRARQINTTLRPVVRDGKTVAWDAYFRLERPNRQYFLDAIGEWQGARGGASVYWQLHAKTEP